MITNMGTIECKYCDTKITYQPSANFIVFCPQCKCNVFIECEYGYGPVTPCDILLGDEKIGTVNVNEKHKYYLDYKSEKIMLRKTYLEALQEASEVVKEKIHPSKPQKELDISSIKKSGGSICFYGDWFGRPGDNYHRIKEYSFDGEILEICFDSRERLIVFEPSGIINSDTEFSICNAKRVKWSWYPYGGSGKEMKKISYEFRNGKIHKISQYGEEIIERKEPYFAVCF